MVVSKTMFPSKSMMEYMTEMNRLFPRSESDDQIAPYTVNPYQSPFQSAMVNRSSSSADSTSPESYPELLFRSTDSPRPLEIPRYQRADTTYTIHRQRPIVGRKILGNSQYAQRLSSPVEKMDTDYHFWQPDQPLAETPPGSSLHPKNYCYELFPSENKGDFKTPVKSEPKMFQVSPMLSNRSPTFPDRSPTSYSSLNRNSSNPSPFSQQTCWSPVSQCRSNFRLGLTIPSRRNPDYTNFSSSHHASKYPYVGASSSIDEITPTKMCTFCRKNGETPIVYMTHCLKEQVGNRHVVTCPILRSHVCATCGESGDNAHTITYCPVLRSNNNGKPLQSTTITLKNTRIKSNGRRRY